MQVMSTRHHSRPRDKVYLLLWDGTLWSVTGSLLEDPQVENAQLDMEMVLGPNLSLEESVIVSNLEPKGSPLLCSEETLKDSEGEWKGFCLYGDKIVLFGYDGLFWYNVEKSKRKKSIYAFQTKIVMPAKINILTPLFSFFNLFK